MVRWLRFGAAMLLALTMCVVFGRVLTLYHQPMEDEVYDLSLNWQGEAMPEDWVYDQKGWTVFTQEGETRKELTPDGLGGFTGLDQPGQTIYFSRLIQEDLDSPTLRLDPAEKTLAVFLDGELLYTDCPQQDNRIGFLHLPMLTAYREDALLIQLPLDCLGKTLTIAQSTAQNFEEGQERVWLCAATLYCGYAYESSLISESFQTAAPAALSYAAGLALLALFLWQAFQGRFDPVSLCGALAAFSYLSARIFQTSFHALYFDLPRVDIPWLCELLTLLALLVLLLCRLSGWRRWVLGGVTALLGGLSLWNLVLAAQWNASTSLIQWHARLGTVALLLALVLAFGSGTGGGGFSGCSVPWSWQGRRPAPCTLPSPPPTGPFPCSCIR